MRVLVTGGTGFIGLRVAAMLHDAGHAVRILDAAPRPERLDALRPGLGGQVEIVAADITDAGAVARAAEGCDGFVHLAGLMTVDCARDPIRGAQVNLLGSLAVFEAARDGARPVAWLSTAGVFGPDSATHPRPMTHYGSFKLAVEGAARAYAADHAVPSLGLRPYIVYGPGISAGIAAGPSIALAAAVRGEEAVIRFSGRVGFVFVDDVARMLVAGLAARQGASVLTMAGDTAPMEEFLAELARQSGWTRGRIEGPPLRIPADLGSDPVPEWLGAQPVTRVADGIARSLAELRQGAAA